MRIFRQGDVILREVEKLPEGKVISETDRLEVSGETGQLHVIEKVKVVQIDWDQYLLTLQEGAVMTHPEHPPLELPPNIVTKVEKVRSVTPYLD